MAAQLILDRRGRGGGGRGAARKKKTGGGARKPAKRAKKKTGKADRAVEGDAPPAKGKRAKKAT